MSIIIYLKCILNPFLSTTLRQIRVTKLGEILRRNLVVIKVLVVSLR